MKKWGISILVTLFLVTGCSNSVHPISTSVIYSSTLKIPSDSDIKSMTVRASELPGAKQATLTNLTDKSTIERVLGWLRNSKEVGLEPPTSGKGGYPPGLTIVTNDGQVIGVGPAVNWTVKKLSDRTEISGTNVVGYVAMGSPNNSAVVRLYSPELYKWIMNREWEF